MKYILIFLFLSIFTFAQDIPLDRLNEQLEKKIESLKQEIPDKHDSMYLYFMGDSIKVEEWYANGLMEFTLLEIELHGYPYLKYLQKTKFLRLPDEILYQIYKIMKKK